MLDARGKALGSGCLAALGDLRGCPETE